MLFGLLARLKVSGGVLAHLVKDQHYFMDDGQVVPSPSSDVTFILICWSLTLGDDGFEIGSIICSPRKQDPAPPRPTNGVNVELLPTYST